MENLETLLNKQQYEAVVSNDKYLRIIAGAGSGKTRVLTYKIAYLIDNLQVKPSEILAITFTNKVAKEMKERIVKLINVNSKDLTIKTFHSFCSYFLRKEIYHNLGIPSNFTILDEDDQKNLIKQTCFFMKINKSDKIVEKAINFIRNEKGKGHYPADVKFNHDKDFSKLMEIFKNYELNKTELYCLDFDDLILRTIQILKTNMFTYKKWSNMYKYILIDEFQDTDDVQYELVRLLVGNDTKLVVVGDPDQTIYSWRGANQKIILDLGNDFHPLKSIVLNYNYRSTKNILDTANKLIDNNKMRYKKDLITENSNGAEVECFKGFTKQEEADYVIKQIIKLKAENNDFSYNQVAILYRASYVTNIFENRLTMNKIPFVIYGGIRFYQRLEIKLALAYIRLVNNFDDDISYLRIINVPRRKIGETTQNLIQEEAKRNNLSIFKYIDNIEKYDASLKANTIIALQTLNSKIKEAKQNFENEKKNKAGIIKKYLDDIGLTDYINSMEEDDDSNSRIGNLNYLIDELHTYFNESETATLDEYLENITLATAQDDLTNSDKVKLMTIHTAKGLEFDYVFVVCCNSDIFPSVKTLLEKPKEGLEEERRLCYVAFTRARKKLFVTCNSDYSFINSGNSTPSIFFKEAGLNINKPRKSQNTQIKRNTYNDMNKNLEDYKKSIKKLYENMNDRKKDLNYKVGDKVQHKKFGVGKVIELQDDILTIDFENEGIKKIIANHPSIEKIM